MSEPLKLAIIGLGRIGAIHAQHSVELALEAGSCRLAAVVEPDERRARSVADELGEQQSSPIKSFASVEELIESGDCAATVVCSPTDQHREHTERLARSGQRVLLEKPFAASLHEARELAALLDEMFPDAAMLAFQRRFDEPLIGAKRLLRQGAIGRAFKIVSVLEDSAPIPQAYTTPNLLPSTSVHNVDEVLWLAEGSPIRAASLGSTLFAHKPSAVENDFDDGFTLLWFADDLVAQISVSRNHVSGYRNETWIYGEDGHIHVGRFEQNKNEVILEAYGRDRRLEHQVFTMRDYDRPVPEFVERFGPAYKQELAEFVSCCRQGRPFSATHRDGLRAMEVIEAGLQGSVRPAAVAQ